MQVRFKGGRFDVSLNQPERKSLRRAAELLRAYARVSGLEDATVGADAIGSLLAVSPASPTVEVANVAAEDDAA